MRRLVEAAGVDYDQWRALTRVAIKLDLRSTSIARHPNQPASKGYGALVTVGIMYLISGAFCAFLVAMLDDVLVSGTVVLTYVMFMVGTMVLIDQQSVITSPDDYTILGFRPVSSRTYFAVRLTNVFIYTGTLTTVFGVIPVVAFAFHRGPHPLLGLAALVAFYLAAAFTTLTLIAVYAGLLRIVGADRLKRVMSYVQLVLSFVVYGGYFGVSRLISSDSLSHLTLPDTSWLYLLPPTWFASYLTIAAGTATAIQWSAAGASLILIAIVARTLASRLSLRYAEELGAITTASAPQQSTSTRRRPMFFTGGENRAVTLLVRAQYRNDQKFRMSVLGFLPLTLLYLFMSMQHGALPDPFTTNWKGAADSSLLSMAILMMPTMLRMSITRSDGYRASWIYYVSPVDRGRLLGATKNVVLTYFLLPYLGLVAALLMYFVRNPVHVLVHVAILGLVSQLLVQFVILLDPALPFSLPVQKGTRQGLLTGVIFLTVMGSMVLVPLLSSLIYVSATRIVALVIALVAASVGIDLLTRLRLARQGAALEFAG